MVCHLNISDLRLAVRLGVSLHEQATPQAVSLSVQISFAHLPPAVFSDQITDTFCYFAMSEHIRAFVLQHEPFHLLEHLGGCIYACVYHDLLQQGYTNAQLEIAVKKIAPPVPDLQDGVTFTYGGSLTRGVADDLYRHWF